MTFAYPLGFLGLIGIPVLILIYIIKNRYTEKVIPSTYIWTMSEKFLKRRVPISKIAGIISLILQILIVVFISFAIAQPSIVLKGAARSYCFVIDASGSMNVEQDGKTRFEIAKDKIVEIIDDSAIGSDYTLIYSGSSAKFVFEETTDKETAIQLVGELSPAHITMDETKALAAAQDYFNYNTSVDTYLLTDKEYKQTGNIKVIDVSKPADNCAITNVEFELVGGMIRITGTAVSYSGDKRVTVNLYFDDDGRLYATQTVEATAEGTEFEFYGEKSSFGFFRVALAEKDALPLDDEVVVYDVAYQNISDILLVSDSPFFMRAALASAGITKLDYILTDEYENNTGYGLYIFDSFMPEVLPDDGAVWFINPKGTLAGADFSFQGEVTPRADARYSTSTSTTVRKLLNGVVDSTDKVNAYKTFTLRNYVKCRVNSSKFYELAYCDGNPVIFVGSNVYGNREAVFSFDVHDSAQFVLSGDLSILVKNLIDYSFPTVIDDTTYICGEEIQINMLAACVNIRVETPSGKVDYPYTSTTICEYTLEEVGVYNIVLVMKDKTERVVNVFAELPEAERAPLAEGNSFVISGTAGNKRTDSFYDILIYLIIAITVLAVADYGLYCYEQYQLR
ncbi:MAG: BatA and WFA domain-containing protein [Clostridiales bacterium]|nr:BatA and WFA domain-containing protein [Clostridiales bacterium]